MIVVLANSIFSRQEPHVAIELVALLGNSRHVVVADTRAPEFTEWAAVAGYFAQRLSSLVMISARVVASGVMKSRINVHRDLSVWNTVVPTLSVDDAKGFIAIPFKVYVENNDADREFLLAFLDTSKKDTILDLEMRNWLEFVHGGGTGDLQKQISREFNNTTRPDLRCFAYFDNDGLKANSPSKKTAQIAAACEEYNIDYHQLSRRAIENYVPLHGLALWARTQSRKRARHTYRQLSPFKKLTDGERDYFNMKEGPHGDGNAVQYPALNAHELRILKKGFGKKLSSIFKSEQFREKMVHLDFQRAAAEVDALYVKLRSRI